MKQCNKNPSPSINHFSVQFTTNHQFALNVQELLEKFEFFPIKCRIQRAMEMMRIGQEHTAAKGGKAGSPFKIKARVKRETLKEREARNLKP